MARSQLANPTIAKGGSNVTVEVVPGTIISGETAGGVLITSKNGRELFKTQKSIDVFIIVAPSDGVIVKNHSNASCSATLYGEEV